MKSLKKISIATICTLLILGTSVFANSGKINAPNGLILRKEASKSGEVITTLDHETQVEVIEKDGEWYKVKYGDSTGYLYSQYVQVEETTENNTEKVEAGNVKVYMIPVITSTVIAEIEKSAEIKIEKQITNWSYITVGNVTGWVRTYALNNEVNSEGQKTEEVLPEEPETVEEEPKVEETNTESNIPQPSNTAQTETKVSETKAFIAVDCANVRSTPDTSVNNIVTALTRGTSFMITAETEEWYKIKYTSPSGEVYEGYIFKELVTK